MTRRAYRAAAGPVAAKDRRYAVAQHYDGRDRAGPFYRPSLAASAPAGARRQKKTRREISHLSASIWEAEDASRGLTSLDVL